MVWLRVTSSDSDNFFLDMDSYYYKLMGIWKKNTEVENVAGHYANRNIHIGKGPTLASLK